MVVMPYEIFYKPSAVKELEGLPREAQAKVLKAIESIKEGDFFKVEKLRGVEGFYRSKRAWPYRILFVIEGRNMRITNIVHRQGAYR